MQSDHVIAGGYDESNKMTFFSLHKSLLFVT